ncbi:alpha-1D adrenergic receptor-like [Arapaima gigas]
MDTVKWIESFVRALMCLSGILGNNWLAIRSLPGQSSRLHTNEALFFNLAISNLITNCLVDMPDTVADFANGWFWGKSYCKVFMFCAALSETSSIFSTLLISVFWNQKLVGSLRRGGAPAKMDNLRLVAVLLAGGWIVAMLFSIPQLFFATLETNNQSVTECTNNFMTKSLRESYVITHATLANAVPIAGIVFASIQPNKSSSSQGTQVRAAKSVVAVASVFLVCWVTHLLLRIYSNVSDVSVLVEVASYIAASYTSIIPYIFLYGVRKLSCSCRK